MQTPQSAMLARHAPDLADPVVVRPIVMAGVCPSCKKAALQPHCPIRRRIGQSKFAHPGHGLPPGIAPTLVV